MRSIGRFLIQVPSKKQYEINIAGKVFHQAAQFGSEFDNVFQFGEILACPKDEPIKAGDVVYFSHMVYKDENHIKHEGKDIFSIPDRKFKADVEGFMPVALFKLNKTNIEPLYHVTVCKPITEKKSKLSLEKEVEQKAEVIVSNVYKKGDIVEFTQHADYEVSYRGQKLKAIHNRYITHCNGEILEGWCVVEPFDQMQEKGNLLVPIRALMGTASVGIVTEGKHKGERVVFKKNSVFRENFNVIKEEQILALWKEDGLQA